MLSRSPQDDPFGISKLDQMEPPHQSHATLERLETSATSEPIPGREAAIAYAVAIEPRYLDACADQLGSLGWVAPLVGSIVGLALNSAAGGATLDAGTISRDLAVLRSCIIEPSPSYLASFNPASFAEALEVQGEQERRRRLRALS
jgi:hypothetical protein